MNQQIKNNPMICLKRRCGIYRECRHAKPHTEKTACKIAEAPCTACVPYIKPAEIDTMACMAAMGKAWGETIEQMALDVVTNSKLSHADTIHAMLCEFETMRLKGRDVNAEIRALRGAQDIGKALSAAIDELRLVDPLWPGLDACEAALETFNGLGAVNKNKAGGVE